MATYRSHRGRIVDMDRLRTQHEGTIAGGNMGVNAKGDRIGKNGEVIESVATRARTNHRKTTTIKRGSLKPHSDGKVEEVAFVEDPFVEEVPVKDEAPAGGEAPVEEKPKKARSKARASKTIDKEKEVELGDGSIEIVDDKEE